MKPSAIITKQKEAKSKPESKDNLKKIKAAKFKSGSVSAYVNPWIQTSNIYRKKVKIT